MKHKWFTCCSALVIAAGVVGITVFLVSSPVSRRVYADPVNKNPVIQNAITKIQNGENSFRFDTFGDQAFWGGQLQLQQAIAQ